jgi:GNAT superfamily N-acetyltransferase
MRTLFGGYEFDDDPARVDRDALWSFLSREAYWERWRQRADVERQLESAWRVVAGYETASGRMIAFSRAVSDGVALAYLADVYVEPDARGQGLGKELVKTMIEAGPGTGFRWMLHTRDAHTMYAALGFTGADERYMERPQLTRQVPG